MTRPETKKRNVLSDTEPDLDDDSDGRTDDTNLTKLNQNHLSVNPKPGTNDGSDNFNDNDDYHDTSDGSRKETSNASSQVRDSSYGNATTRLDNDVAKKNRRRKTVRQKAGTGGIDLHNIIAPPSRASIKSNSANDDDERPVKRQRLTRGRVRTAVSYDMKHHPMDDILRPKYSAKRRGSLNQVSEESSDKDGETGKNQESGTSSGKLTPLNSHRRRSTRSIRKSENPIYSSKWHPLDQMLKDKASSTSSSKKSECSKEARKFTESPSTLKDDQISRAVSSDRDCDKDIDSASDLEGKTGLVSPSRRRSVRVLSSRDAPPNYDMKYHVMDSTLRPKATAKRIKSKLQSAASSKTLRNSALSRIVHTEQLAYASRHSLTRRPVHHTSQLEDTGVLVAPSGPRLRNPYLNHSSLNWAELQEMDRCIYLLQKGAPLHGNTLPQDWTHDAVKKVLFDEGIDPLDELSSRGNTEILKTRYESVRLGLQNFFESEPEAVNKNCWKLSKTEGFDVYDMELGSRYWTRQRDNVVSGISTSSSSNTMSSIAKTLERVIISHNRKVTESNPEEQDRNDANTPTSMQSVTNKRGHGSNTCLEALEFDSKQTIIVDLEDDGENVVVTETEDNVVESMRGEHTPSSIMSHAALDELLSSAEQFLAEESDHTFTADVVSSSLGAFKSAELVLAHPNNTLDESSSVTPQAKAMDLKTSSCHGLDEPIQVGKERKMPSFLVGPHDEYEEPQTPKAVVKARKRKSRADLEVAVHEDLPGRTPLIRMIVHMNPASPGTDIPKENLENDASVEHSSQAERGILQFRRDIQH